MIVIDANLLLYAYDSTSPLHGKARAWLESVFSGTDPVAIPWNSVAAFLRVITNRKLPGDRLSVETAAKIVDSWVQQPNVQILGPAEDHWAYFRRMLVDGQAPGNLVSDAMLAALTLEVGGTLYTTDRDFARFPTLRWTNPLQ